MNKYIFDNIQISTKIPQRLLLLTILYFFHNADLFEIYCTTNIKVIVKKFIDKVFLLGINSSILKNKQLLKKIYLSYYIT